MSLIVGTFVRISFVWIPGRGRSRILVVQNFLAEAGYFEVGKLAVGVVKAERDYSLPEQVPKDFAEKVTVVGRQWRGVVKLNRWSWGISSAGDYLRNAKKQVLILVRRIIDLLSPCDNVDGDVSDFFVSVVHS